MSENLTNKTCGECKYFNGLAHGFCKNKQGRLSVQVNDPICQNYKQKPTNGDVIRQGGNKRLITFSTEWSCFHCAYQNGIEKKCERPEGKDCFDGIEAWLNAPAESEGGEDEMR